MTSPPENNPILKGEHAKSVSTCNFNPEDFYEELSELELTQNQANELLQTLWHIMSIFVDIGWGVDAVQIMLPELYKNIALDSAQLLESKQALNDRDKEEGAKE